MTQSSVSNAQSETGATLLVDGTAIFLRARQDGMDRFLDYNALLDCLCDEADVDDFDTSIFFTTYDASNDGQSKFLNFIADELGWRIEKRQVWEADPFPRSPNHRPADDIKRIRFDSMISFAVGRLMKPGRKIFVVSDSFSLSPALYSAAVGGADVTLAFFRHHLDPRWIRSYPQLKNSPNILDNFKFMDLDQESAEIFSQGQSKKPTTAPTPNNGPLASL